MLEVVIGNICSLLACACDSISGTRKTKKDILITQIVSQSFYIVSSIALKAYSAAVQNIVTIFRNIYSVGEKQSVIIEWIFIICQVGFGLYFNNLGLLGLIPIVANLEYSLVLFALKNNTKIIKISFMLSVFLFAIFNFLIMNYVGGISCVVIVITITISMYKGTKENKGKSNNKYV